MLLCQASSGAGGWLECFNSSAARACEGDAGGVEAWAEPGQGLPPLWVCCLSCASACLGNLLLPFEAQASVCGVLHVGSKLSIERGHFTSAG